MMHDSVEDVELLLERPRLVIVDGSSVSILVTSVVGGGYV